MFVNTKLFSPVSLHGLTKAPKGSYEYVEWWNEEKRRCLEGYEVGGVRITGPHYFYLNYCLIRKLDKKEKRKSINYPRFLDIDFEFFHYVEEARNKGKNLCLAKKRQAGYSYKAAALITHEATFYKNSQIVVVAGQEIYADNTRNYALYMLNDLAHTGPAFYKRKSPATGDHVILRYKEYDNNVGDWVWKGYNSEIYTLTAKNNPEVVSRLSPTLIVFEECGRFEKVADTFGFVRPSLESEGEQTGFALFIGTGGDMDEGIAQFKRIFYNPDDYNCLAFDNEWSDDPNKKKICLFVPGWKYYLVDEQGNSLKEESIAKMQENRVQAADSTDRSKLIKEIISRPENPDEIFWIVKGTRFNTAKLNAQYLKIIKSKNYDNMMKRVSAKWTYDGVPKPGFPNGSINGVEWWYDPNGPIEMLFEPELDSNGKPKKRMYYSGTDSYDKDDAVTSDSMLSTSIFNARHKRFDARVTVRPAKAEDAWELSFMLSIIYGASNLIEWSNIGIFGWAERAGLLNWVKERPRVAYADVINSQVNNQFGIDPNTRYFWIQSYADYIEDYSENMFDLTQIDRALVFREKTDKGKKFNCDITISSSLAYVNYLDDIEYIREIAEAENREVKEEFVYFKAVQGTLTRQIYK